jgi:serine-type D-Ala-D-Ala carboxypeptidase (penicillin-binding protein 5/6)
MNGTRILHTCFLSLLISCLLFIFVSPVPAAPVKKSNGTHKHIARTTSKKNARRIVHKKKTTLIVEKKKTPRSVGKHRVSRHKALRPHQNPHKNRVARRPTRRTPSRQRSVSEISAKSAIIIDAASGNTLFAKSPDIPRQPASTIKVLTGMIAIRSLNYSDQVQISPKAAGQPSSKVFLDTHKQYMVNDLINAVLMASANDASVALAEKIAGSEQSFAQRMTSFAHQWGATQTVCKTATGLTAQGQETTARDLATIFRHAMEDQEFATRMKRINVRTAEGKVLRSHNRALWQVEGSQGGKTGYTDAARQTYVGKFKRGNNEIIVAVMGCERMWIDLKRLVELGFSIKNSHQIAIPLEPIDKMTSGKHRSDQNS